jgi:hypothetical protein
MKDEFPTVMLVSIKMPGLEIEPTNPAQLICGYAGGVLNDLLSVELSASNLLSEPSTGGARQFPGTLPFAVEDVRAAADVAWGVLKRNGLDSWAAIFFFDGDELLWRSIYPRAGIGLLQDDVLAEWAACESKLSEVRALWRKAQEGSGAPRPDGETGGEK